ncbi:hypothetical protein [Nocardioides sp. URHA0032]|uniref:hypothetical protein n=1 Tax=Nocardioides sp. URHA0032 TaxID=1380388 RepID=UPI00048E964E|nr:hypothetical protein [Nocardioides sp. URHA0032]
MGSVVDQLIRWEESGGTWYAVGTTEVALCRCDGGEIVERLRVEDAETAAYLRRRPSSDPAGDPSGG